MSVVANIKATVTSTGLSQSTSQSITLFTPNASGIYRVSIYPECPSSSSAILAPFHLAFTDAYGSHSQLLGTPQAGSFVTGGSQSPLGSTSVLRAISSNAITLNIDANPGGPDYNVYAVVEKLYEV